MESDTETSHKHSTQDEPRDSSGRNNQLEASSLSKRTQRRMKHVSDVSAGQERKSRNKGNQGSPTHFNSNDEIEFNNQTKIQQVLKTLKEDIVPFNKSRQQPTNKWRTMVDNMQQVPLDSLYQQQHGNNNEDEQWYDRSKSNLSLREHEQIDRSQVGADIYSNKWKKLVRHNKAVKKPDELVKRLELMRRNREANDSKKRANQNYDEENPSKVQSSLNFIHKLCFYFSGLLAGLLLWPTLFSFSVLKGESMLVKGPIFWTLYSLVATVLILIVAIGFMNSATINEYSTDFWKLVCHLVPVLLLLVCHYLNKAFELQKMECKAYHQLKVENRQKIHLSYNCSQSTKGNDMERHIGFIFIHSIPGLAALGIYTYLYSKQYCVNSSHQ